jgi:Zn-dependent protease with chaperone function
VADYTFEQSLASACAVCGVGESEAVARDGYALLKFIAPLSDECPVGTFVGVCRGCVLVSTARGLHLDPPLLWYGFRSDWSPPPLTRPVGGEPLYVVRFGHVDDRLARVVGRVWRKLPVEVRATLRGYLTPAVEAEAVRVRPTLTKGALRVEALRVFPGSRRALGQCLHRGHTVRLLAGAVNAMPDKPLAALVAHELAHVYQEAAWKEFRRGLYGGGVEEDARGLMTAWGFQEDAIDRWAEARDEERCLAELRRMQRRRSRDEDDEQE